MIVEHRRRKHSTRQVASRPIRNRIEPVHLNTPRGCPSIYDANESNVTPKVAFQFLRGDVRLHHLAKPFEGSSASIQCIDPVHRSGASMHCFLLPERSRPAPRTGTDRGKGRSLSENPSPMRRRNPWSSVFASSLKSALSGRRASTEPRG